MRSGGIIRENVGNLIYQTVHFVEYLWDNWSTECVHFAVLNTDVEAFLNRSGVLAAVAVNVSHPNTGT